MQNKPYNTMDLVNFAAIVFSSHIFTSLNSKPPFGVFIGHTQCNGNSADLTGGWRPIMRIYQLEQIQLLGEISFLRFIGSDNIATATVLT